MTSNEVLQKIWMVRSDHNEGTKWSGGICVAQYGLIIAHLRDISPTNLFGQFYKSDKWYNLKLCYENKFYNLAVLEVVLVDKEDIDKGEVEKLEADKELAFSYFDIGVSFDEGCEMLERGTLLHCVDLNKSFSSRIGYISRRDEKIFYPEEGTGVLEVSSSDIRDARDEFDRGDPPYLCVKHILCGQIAEAERLMGNTPVIQALDLGIESPLLGSPVFDEGDNLIGLYYLHYLDFSYIIPIGVFYHFMSLMPTSAGVPQGYEAVKNMLSGKKTREDL